MKVTKNKLIEVARDILRGLGATDEEAAIVAKCLVRADMRGVDTHGVQFLRVLSDRVEARVLRTPTTINVLKDEKATILIDGGNGFGQMASHLAMEMSIQKAKSYGIGCSLVRNTNNVGMLAFYTLMASDAGVVGIAITNSAPFMPPWGGTEPFFGTNPISIAVPSGTEVPLVLDMATTMAAVAKIHRAHERRETIPLGWALDETGTPTTDPDAALEGSLLPIGGPKGYGLALMIDVLAGMLSGSKYGPDVGRLYEMLGPLGAGFMSIAIDVERFMPLHQFKRLMKTYTESIREGKKAKGVSRIYLPGEIEYEKEKASLVEGIEINPKVVAGLNQLLERFKSALRLPEE